MAEKWFEDLPEDFFESEADRAYRESFAQIRKGLEEGLGFDDACAAVEIKDEDLRKQIITDMLKVIIAEEHFAKKIPLEELAGRLKVQPEVLETAKLSMFEDIEKGGQVVV